MQNFIGLRSTFDFLGVRANISFKFLNEVLREYPLKLNIAVNQKSLLPNENKIKTVFRKTKKVLMTCC
jgi:hypothetical protein